MTLARIALAVGDWPISHLGRWRRSRSDIALVRLDGVGDFLLWLNAAKYLRNYYDGRKIILWANVMWADFARTLPYWDEVVAVDVHRFGRNPFYRWGVMLHMWWQHYTVAVQPTFYRHFLLGDSLIRASGADSKIGWDCDTGVRMSESEKAKADQWYSRLLSPAAPLNGGGQIERNAEFVALLSGHVCHPEIAQLPRNADCDLLPREKYCVLFPGAGRDSRRWPAEYFSELGNMISRQFGWEIVLCGSLAEKPLCEAIADHIAEPVQNMAGKTSLAELVEVIRGAEMLVSNETSAIHIAPAVGTPSVCVLGGGHYGLFVPYPETLAGLRPVPAIKRMACYQCNWTCTQPHEVNGPVPCIRDIGVPDVFALVCETARQAEYQS